jgi:Rod binding domain-containing protein
MNPLDSTIESKLQSKDIERLNKQRDNFTDLDTEKAVKAAIDFEAMLVKQMLVSMTKSLDGEGFFGGEAGSDFYNDLFISEVSQQMAKEQSFGLSTQILKNVKPNTKIMTDEWVAYSSLNKYKDYIHSYIKHSQKEYVDGEVHTNTIESVWAILKRGFIGIYHVMSRKHLQRYVDEFVFRYNTRNYNENDRFHYFFKNMKNRLKWKDLVGCNVVLENI